MKPAMTIPQKTTTYEKKTTMTVTATRSNAMNLIYEALSRARMRRPQNANSEAPHSARPARRVAMAVRHRQAIELGNLLR